MILNGEVPLRKDTIGNSNEYNNPHLDSIRRFSSYILKEKITTISSQYYASLLYKFRNKIK